jgi:hypothetical protein
VAGSRERTSLFFSGGRSVVEPLVHTVATWAVEAVEGEQGVVVEVLIGEIGCDCEL